MKGLVVLLVVAVLGLLLSDPTTTHAGPSFPSCGLPSDFPPEWAERCAEEHRIAEEAEKKAAEEATQAATQKSVEIAKAAEEQAPAMFLNVRVRSQHGQSYADPGRTDITVTTSPFSAVTVTGLRGLLYSNFRQLPGGKIETGDYGEVQPGEGDPEAGPGKFEVDWSCHRRGQRIHYTVRAQGSTGPPITHTGYFTIALTARWCAEAKHNELTQEARYRTEEREEATARAQHERESHERETKRFETNCRAIGGIPVEIRTNEGRRVVCRSKTGGILLVPQ